MSPAPPLIERIPSADARVRSPDQLTPRVNSGGTHAPLPLSLRQQVASKTHFDVAIIGSGILGSALAYSLATSGRSVVVLERDLSEPDRIVGELLQPGGCLALQKIGIDDALEGIDATPCKGYEVFWGDQSVRIPYPEETKSMIWSDGSERKQEGRSFHHGRFIQNLRTKAVGAENVTMVEATVNDLVEDESGRIVGVKATPKRPSTSASDSDPDDSTPFEFRARLTIVADGCMSKFRRQLLPSHVQPITRSHFVGLVLEDPDLPSPHHGHVILGKSDPTQPAPPPSNLDVPSLGPVLVYQLATHETRMLVDVRGHKLPPARQLASFLRTHVSPVLPRSIVASFERALVKAESGDKAYRLRSMPNSYLASYPQGRENPGAILAGDSMNMRHPLTGGGMTVALNDVVILTELLGGGTTVKDAQPDARGVVDLDDWNEVSERLEEWHWKRKGVASCVNILSMALYSLFGADDENLEVLKTGCFKYFEMGGDCIDGPVSLLSALRPNPALLFYHFFRVAFYSIYLLFTLPRFPRTASPGRTGASSGDDKDVTIKPRKPTWGDYPALTVQSFKVFWTAVVVFMPVLWKEGQM
ncbi:hypothetical protein JCM10212_000151 [Sporobolomyces blumeae]